MYYYSIAPLVKKYPNIVLSQLQIESCRREQPFTWTPAVLVIMNIDRQFQHPGTKAITDTLAAHERRVDRQLSIADLTFYETLRRLDAQGYSRVEIKAKKDLWPMIEVDISKLRKEITSTGPTIIFEMYERHKANGEFPYSLLYEREITKERELRFSTCTNCHNEGKTVEIFGRYAKPRKNEKGSGERFDNTHVDFYTTCNNCRKLDHHSLAPKKWLPT